MKKIFWIAAAVAGLFAAASCQKENASASGDVNANSSANVNQNLNTTFPSNRSDYQGTVN